MRNMATDRELEVWLSEKENAMVEDIAAWWKYPASPGSQRAAHLTEGPVGRYF